MTKYVLTRLAQLAPVLLVAVLLNFVLIRLAPGDPLTFIVGDAPISAEAEQQVREDLGLDGSLLDQLGAYLGNLVTGDLGFSYFSRVPVTEVLASRLPATLLLMTIQFVLAIAGGLVLGVMSASRQGTLLDGAITGLSVVGYAIPVFWLGLILIFVFSVTLGWLPVSGMTTARFDLEGWSKVLDVGKHLILPAFTLAFYNLAVITRLTRATTVEALGQDYVVFARAKGTRERVVLFRHALKNALLPVITVIGTNVRTLVGGAVLTETVFGWPGIGRLTYESIVQRDYPVLSGIFILTAITVMIVTLLTDLTYAYVDPRIRLGKEGAIVE